MRELSEIEIQRLKILTGKSIQYSLLMPTANGLKKGIMDAPFSFREYLKRFAVHNYNDQKQGPENKISVNSGFLQKDEIIDSIATLYRPKTKRGDPRIWFSGLPKYTKENDVLAIAILNSRLIVMNISSLAIEDIFSSGSNVISATFLNKNEKSDIAQELLEKLQHIARQGPLPAKGSGDSSVGFTLGNHLGIETSGVTNFNYKGIKIRTFRRNIARQQNRKSLFSQVPDWGLSMFKSSEQILDHLGYKGKNDDLRLFCTVNALSKNSQGLILKMDNQTEWLIESSDNPKIGDFAIWWLSDLRKTLLNKHSETFWISANTVFKDGNEFFQYDKVMHTRAPLEAQFDMLLEQGKISLDHTIKRKKGGTTRDHGYLFRIDHDAIDLLFPESIEYNLLAK